MRLGTTRWGLFAAGNPVGGTFLLSPLAHCSGKERGDLLLLPLSASSSPPVTNWSQVSRNELLVSRRKRDGLDLLE